MKWTSLMAPALLSIPFTMTPTGCSSSEDAATSDATLSVEEFITAASTAYCELGAYCCVAAGKSARADCAETKAKQMRETVAKEHGDQAVVVDAMLARGCLRDYENMLGDCPSWDNDPCMAAIVPPPTAAVGEPCNQSTECLQNAGARVVCEPTRCAYNESSASCEDMRCAEVREVPAGTPCPYHAESNTMSVCDDASSCVGMKEAVCVADSGEGESCTASQCGPGLGCFEGQSGLVCERLGTPCEQIGDCQAGELCYIHGYCYPKPLLAGDPCSEDWQCLSGLCASNGDGMRCTAFTAPQSAFVNSMTCVM